MYRFPNEVRNLLVMLLQLTWDANMAGRKEDIYDDIPRWRNWPRDWQGQNSLYGDAAGAAYKLIDHYSPVKIVCPGYTTMSGNVIPPRRISDLICGTWSIGEVEQLITDECAEWAGEITDEIEMVGDSYNYCT